MEPSPGPASPATPEAPPPAPFDAFVGLRVLESGPDRVVTELNVRPELFQPYGITHGGVYCAVVESTASIGADSWAQQRGGRIVGVSNHTDFLRSTSGGTLRAQARPVQRGRLQQLWQVHIHDDQDRHIARGTVRFVNLPPDRQSG